MSRNALLSCTILAALATILVFGYNHLLAKGLLLIQNRAAFPLNIINLDPLSCGSPTNQTCKPTSLAGRPRYQSLQGNSTYSVSFPDDENLCFHLNHIPASYKDSVDFDSEEEEVDFTVYFAGLGGSRLEQFIDYERDKSAPNRAARSSRKARIILTLDRPGLGCSSHMRHPPSVNSDDYGDRYLHVAERVGAVLQALEVTNFDTVGWSSGGPYALALGHYITTSAKAKLNVTRVSLVASDLPWAQAPWRIFFDAPHRECNLK
jgi:hypothetical protein